MSEPESKGERSLLSRWRFAMSTANPPPGKIDAVTRWLVITRAAVQPMTLTSAAIAGLLALHDRDLDVWPFALAAIGLVLAHAANNVMNDLFDLRTGLDTRDYPRALYAPHPVLSGLTTTRRLILGAAVLNGLDAVVLVALWIERGWPILLFAAAGLFLSVAYTAPPFQLKRRGLGEPSVLLVWGPLMVGGTYYAATGRLPLGIVAASFPYALLATSVLMGKHIDKVDWDRRLGIRTLPVLLGERMARRLTQAMMAAFYIMIVVLVIWGPLPWPSLVALVGITRLLPVWRAFGKPKPDGPPKELPDYPVWPLWFAAGAFVHARRAGALFVLGLAVGAVFFS